MKTKKFLFVLLITSSISANAQNFSTLTGTFRFGGGLYGSIYSYGTPVTIGLLQALKASGVDVGFDLEKWSTDEHTLFRFFKISGDFLIPCWSMTSSNIPIELQRTFEDSQTNSLNHSVRQYTNFIGYWLNWKSMFSRIGFWGGIDIEWRSFVIYYPYPNMSYFNIRSYVPSCGVRYRLFSPIQEIEGIPFNIVFEGGLSYVINTSFYNSEGYDKNALNNGFRPMFGIVITTNRYGSIHLRWTKDLYNLFNNDYSATKGPLFNNEIHNDFSCYSIGWSIFI